jgi:hypothetical protein
LVRTAPEADQASVEGTTLAAESITLGRLRSYRCRDLLIYCEAHELQSQQNSLTAITKFDKRR